jgi:hypothetical protein
VAVFTMLTMFPVNVLNTKVVVNFHILLVLEFYDFRSASLGIIVFANSISVSVCFLNRSDR